MKYRLLKVICQAVLITEDEEGNLIENVSNPVPVPFNEWLDYPKVMLDQIATLNMESSLEAKPS